MYVVIKPIGFRSNQMQITLCYGANTMIKKLFNSKSQAQEYTNGIRIIQEALSSIREIIISNLQTVYCNAYEKSIRKLQKSQIALLMML